MEKNFFYFNNNKAHVLDTELHNYRKMNNTFLINDYIHTLAHISPSIYDIKGILLLYIIIQCDISSKISIYTTPCLFSNYFNFFWYSKHNLKQKKFKLSL